MSDQNEYTPPKVWTWESESGGKKLIKGPKYLIYRPFNLSAFANL